MDIRALDNIKRWLLYDTHNKQTVASHSFYVALLTKDICEEYGLSQEDTLEAIIYALYHDAPEAVTGDVPYSAKRKHPEIEKALRKAEDTIYKELNIERRDEIKAIVKLADVLEAYHYCKAEVALGNTNFIRLREEAHENVVKWRLQVERYWSDKEGNADGA